ncbi:MAG: hypothetical protein IPH05_06150 [Flavobacteriales bacterium]|nr:hypothetical protein [Flavobacteriales bacterium]
MHRTERSPWSLALWISTVALASMPLLGMRPMVFVIIVWLILALFVRMRSANPTMVDRTALIVLSVPFLLIVLDLLRADSIASGWPFVERSAALVVFPIGFLLLGAPTDARTRSWFTTVFTLSGTVLALVVNALMLPYHSEAWENDAPFSSTYRYELADISGVHPPYAAYWFLVGALFQLDVLLGAFNKWRPLRSLLWRTASVIILVVTALFIGSRMPLFAFGAGVVVLLFMRLPRAVAVRLSVLAMFLLGAAVLLSPGIRERMVEVLPFGNTTAQHIAMNSIEIRGPITDCSLALLEENWMRGCWRCRSATFPGRLLWLTRFGPHGGQRLWATRPSLTLVAFLRNTWPRSLRTALRLVHSQGMATQGCTSPQLPPLHVALLFHGGPADQTMGRGALCLLQYLLRGRIDHRRI